jgi:hypothetical protein
MMPRSTRKPPIVRNSKEAGPLADQQGAGDSDSEHEVPLAVSTMNLQVADPQPKSRGKSQDSIWIRLPHQI